MLVYISIKSTELSEDGRDQLNTDARFHCQFSSDTNTDLIWYRYQVI